MLRQIRETLCPGGTLIITAPALQSLWTHNDDLAKHARRTHSTPPWPVNRLLGLIFAAETPLGAWLPFPWGTSVLAVMRRPR